MSQEPQKSNTVLIIVAVIGVVGTILATTIGAIGNYTVEKLRQDTELTRIALASTGITQISSTNITPSITVIPVITLTSTIPSPTNTPVITLTSPPESSQIGTMAILTVYAKQAWQNTNFFISEGTYFEIKYISGQWSLCANYGCPYFDANGAGFETPQDNAVAGCKDAELVARLSDGTPFCVGNIFSGIAKSNGYLELRTNDAILDDNEGSVTVSIFFSK